MRSTLIAICFRQSSLCRKSGLTNWSAWSSSIRLLAAPRSDPRHIMKTSNFTYYMHDGPAAFSFELAGTLSPDDAVELEQAWRTASSVIGDRILVVDLTFVTQIDEAGRDLLRRWRENGANFVGNSPTSRLLAESIIGAALPTATPAPAPTYEPHFTQLTP